MAEGLDLHVLNLIFLLLCFEAMSGLKFNFNKNGFIILGYSTTEQHRIADNLNCMLAAFPISYLGMLMSDSRVLLGEFDPLMVRVASQVKLWGGRLTSKRSKSGPYWL